MRERKQSCISAAGNQLPCRRSQVYETSKFFAVREHEKEDGSSTDETSILTSASMTGSLAESCFSHKDSGQGDERDSTLVEELETDDGDERAALASPSVKRLVRRFSRKDAHCNDGNKMQLFTSCGNIYEDCQGKGVTPNTCCEAGAQVVARFQLTTWAQRNASCDSLSSLRSDCGSEAGLRVLSCSSPTTACSSVCATPDRRCMSEQRCASRGQVCLNSVRISLALASCLSATNIFSLHRA